jgi:hypothetical protein
MTLPNPGVTLDPDGRGGMPPQRLGAVPDRLRAAQRDRVASARHDRRPDGLTAALVEPSRVPDLAARFFERQRACYARHGAEAAVVEPWWEPGAAWLVCVLDGASELAAGARLAIRGARTPLPVEEALGAHDRLREEIGRRARGGLAEVGALWASDEVAGSGIGGAVIATSVAFAAVLGVRHLVSLAHDRTRFAQRVGFEPDLDIGPQPYPDARYRSLVCWCDAQTVQTAEPTVRAAIFEMRRRAFRGGGVPVALYPRSEA